MLEPAFAFGRIPRNLAKRVDQNERPWNVREESKRQKSDPIRTQLGIGWAPPYRLANEKVRRMDSATVNPAGRQLGVISPAHGSSS